MLSFANDRMTMPQTFTRRLVAARRETPFGVCESTRAGLTLCRLQQSAPRGTSACQMWSADPESAQKAEDNGRQPPMLLRGMPSLGQQRGHAQAPKATDIVVVNYRGR